MAKTQDQPESADVPLDNETSPRESLDERFVGQWNRLISTTNWEKGRIICQWREALMTSGAAVSEYSDETWAQRVGGVSSQHVGRLRRVFQRFGEVLDQYHGLYWSHFQASLDWDDAEMWLEGAIQNEWSVSQMRGKRWEVAGAPGEAPPANGSAAMEEEISEDESDGEATRADDGNGAVTPTQTMLKSVDPPDEQSSTTETVTDDSPDAINESNGELSDRPINRRRERLTVEVDELPDDLAEAFEQFKLAIIAHRREGWAETDVEQVVECLDALRTLALAPMD